jgi:hypothetical protein
VSRAPYELERTATADAALENLSDTNRRDVEAHLETVRRSPLPAGGIRIRPHRGKVPQLPAGFEGPFWSRVADILVFHAVHRGDRRVVVLLVVPQQALDPG